MAYVNLGQVMYPVGAIYQSWSGTSPASLFGGSWTPITGRFLYCTNSAGGTGGASTVTLTANQMPSHHHSQEVYSTDGSSTTMPAWTMYIGERWSGTGAVRANDGTTRKAQHGATGWGPTSTTGGGASHENMPPYIKCYTWRRTA